jgi:hypothetical protein
LLKTGALQSAIFNSANFSSIATDANGVIQIFNFGAERRSVERRIGDYNYPGFEALVFKAKRPLLKVTKPTTTPKKGALKRAVEQYNKDSHEKRNENTVQIPSHRAGQ